MIIAITGKMCSGKSTAAKYLEEKYNFKIHSFGEPVKKYAALIFKDTTKNRPIIQDFAQKVKEIDENVWVNYLLRNIDKNDNIVIDDLRFPNEYDALYKLGATIIKIDIDDAFQICRLKHTYPDNYTCHISRRNNISEMYIDQIKSDYVFQLNPDSEDKMYTFMDTIINNLRNK